MTALRCLLSSLVKVIMFSGSQSFPQVTFDKGRWWKIPRFREPDFYEINSKMVK